MTAAGRFNIFITLVIENSEDVKSDKIVLDTIYLWPLQ